MVHRLAEQRSIAGFVRNTSRGVIIEAEGDAPVLDAFCRSLREHLPPLAEIARLEVAEIPPRGDTDFTIRESSEEADAFSLVPPDVATCDSCIEDFTVCDNRRYGYPFTNCTHCGPRYSIIQNVPYDRYHHERNHQGLGNRLIMTEESCADRTGAVHRRQRLGGMLNYYYRQAA